MSSPTSQFSSSPLEASDDTAEHVSPPVMDAAAIHAARPAATRSAIPSVDTPVMRQYLEIKERYPDCILFFRMGDFYEMFFDDAIIASQLLDLTLTARDKQKEVPVPMAGVPHHAAKGYIGRLVAQGKKVAICDQIEDAKKAKKIVRRAVTQVVTPGVLLDEDQLEPKANNYLAALQPGPSGRMGLAYLDASTGEFAATELPEAEAIDELLRIEPAEVLLCEEPQAARPKSAPVGASTDAEARRKQVMTLLSRRLRAPIGQSRASTAADDQVLLKGLLAEVTSQPAASATTTTAPSSEAWPLAISAAAACVRYARATQPVGGLPLYRLRLYHPTDSLVIDESTQSNLELLHTLMERKRHGSLLGVMDQTRTAMGGRLLRRWLLQPLQQREPILRRHDAVEFLTERQAVRSQAREVLGEIHDLERLTDSVDLLD